MFCGPDHLSTVVVRFFLGLVRCGHGGGVRRGVRGDDSRGERRDHLYAYGLFYGYGRLQGDGGGYR